MKEGVQAGPPEDGRRYKYYDLAMAAFVTVLVCSNVIGAAKVATLGASRSVPESFSFRSAISSTTF